MIKNRKIDFYSVASSSLSTHGQNVSTIIVAILQIYIWVNSSTKLDEFTRWMSLMKLNKIAN